MKSDNINIYSSLFSTLLFLFFIQQITFLVESIYMLNLLHTSMDAKALGLFLLALPVFLFFLKPGKTNYVIIVGILLICSILSPVLPTPFRIFSSGLGAGLFLLYLGLRFADAKIPLTDWGQAAALATLTSIAFRAVGHTLDISLTGNTKFIGWILVLAAGFFFIKMIKEYSKISSEPVEERELNGSGTWLKTIGLIGSILLIYIAFSSPGVIASWTEGNYLLVNVILVVSIWLLMAFGSSKILSLKGVKGILLTTNIIFILLLLANILAHRVPFPVSPDSASYMVGETSLPYKILTYIMMLFSPVLFLNISVLGRINVRRASNLAGPFLVAVLLIILVVFMLIFTNVWGYTKPVSAYFRNQFHLPFLLTGFIIVLPFVFLRTGKFNFKSFSTTPGWSRILYLFLVILSCSAVFKGNKKTAVNQAEITNELTLMTYNIQQGVDLFGNKNYEGQLEIIREINPDIIGLQESDGSRISGGNSDVVRYFSEKLGYYSYFGPKTVTGTFGTAILSRFPLESCRTVFTYSDKDEIGTAVSEIKISDQIISIINSHPAGGEDAKMAHIKTVVELAGENKMAIAMGDYNFRQGSPYYEHITNKMNDAWLSLYPDAIGPVDTDKLDLTFRNRKRSGGKLLDKGKQDMTGRIDHIFLSKEFTVKEAHYIPAPESGTDHPVHWAKVSW